MPSAILIKPTGEVARVSLSDLGDFQAAVGGDIEAVPLPEIDMILNENGLDLDLPVNPVATRLAKEELAKDGRALITQDGWVLGPVLLVGKPDEFGDETDCPPLAIEAL